MEDNRIIEFSDDDILMDFEIGDQEYAVIKGDMDDESEELEVYYVKVNNIDGERIARIIEDNEELDMVEKAFNDMLDSFEMEDE